MAFFLFYYHFSFFFREKSDNGASEPALLLSTSPESKRHHFCEINFVVEEFLNPALEVASFRLSEAHKLEGYAAPETIRKGLVSTFAWNLL